MMTVTDDLPGFRLRVVGVVSGSAIRDAHGVEKYTKNHAELLALAERTRQQALFALMQNASRLGANALVGIRFSEHAIAGGVGLQAPVVEVATFATAVRADPTT